MRILVSLILVLSLCLCAVSAPAESDEYEFLISDWKYVTGAEGAGQAEKTIFFYDDYDFEILDSEEIETGFRKTEYDPDRGIRING